MKSYTWWKQQKRRVQKKYTLFLGMYFSPKDTKAFERKLILPRLSKKMRKSGFLRGKKLVDNYMRMTKWN